VPNPVITRLIVYVERPFRGGCEQQNDSNNEVKSLIMTTFDINDPHNTGLNFVVLKSGG